MKIVIQNGCDHVLNRGEVDALVGLLPQAWLISIRQIVLYQSQSSDLYAEYYPKQGIVGLFCPEDYAGSKMLAANELLISIVCIAENGGLPRKMSKSNKRHYLNETENISDEFAKSIE